MASLNNKKSVSFDGTVIIFEFAIELGDHPCCSEGAPIQLGNRHHQAMYTRSLEVLEYNRQENGIKSPQLRMSASRRLEILLNSGYSQGAIAAAVLRSLTVREERAETLKKLGSDRFIKLLKTTGKLPKGILKGVLGTTGDILSTAGGLVKRIVSTEQRTVQARSA